jgi:hypothetical protein
MIMNIDKRVFGPGYLMFRHFQRRNGVVFFKAKGQFGGRLLGVELGYGKSGQAKSKQVEEPHSYD